MVTLFIQPTLFGIKKSTIDTIKPWNAVENKGTNEADENQQYSEKNQNDIVSEVKKIPSEQQPENSFVIEETGTIVHYLLRPNEVYNIDLNQDGIEEQVEVKVYDMDGNDITGLLGDTFEGKSDDYILNSDDFSSVWDYSTLGGNVGVMINKKVSYICDGDDMISYIIVTDIDKSKAGLDLLISDLGPSLDFFTTILNFDGHDILKLGYVYDIPINTLKIDGTGKMTGTARTWFVYTWERPVEYVVVDNKVVEEKKEKYGMHVNGTLVDTLKLYTSPSFDEVAKKLYEDEKVTLLYSNAKNWCYIQDEDGEFGYAKVDDRYIDEIIGLPVYD